MPVDLVKFRELVKTDPWLRAVLHALGRSHIRRNITSYKLLAKSVDAPDHTKTMHHGILGAFRMLESCGAGHVNSPTNKSRLCFFWKVWPSAMCAAALSEQHGLNPTDYIQGPRDAAAPKPPENPPAMQEGWVRYRFPLRTGVEVSFDLPGDLTDEEAQRLGHLLRAAASAK